MEEHSDCLGIVNNAAMNMGLQRSLQDPYFKFFGCAYRQPLNNRDLNGVGSLTRGGFNKFAGSFLPVGFASADLTNRRSETVLSCPPKGTRSK